MQTLLAFAPFIVFAVIDRTVGSIPGTIAGAIVALLMLGRETLFQKRSSKILDIGTAILFCGLSIFFLATKPEWSVITVRLCVDTGLFIIVVVSLVVGKPFTLQYAREQVSPDLWNRPEFLKTNYVISGVWALAFAVAISAEIILLLARQVPQRFGTIAIVLAIVGATKFSGSYPQQVRR